MEEKKNHSIMNFKKIPCGNFLKFEQRLNDTEVFHNAKTCEKDWV